MPKMKSNRSLNRRFRRSANGKLKRKKAGHRHLASNKSTKRKRNLRQTEVVDKSDQQRLANWLAK